MNYLIASEVLHDATFINRISQTMISISQTMTFYTFNLIGSRKIFEILSEVGLTLSTKSVFQELTDKMISTLANDGLFLKIDVN